MISENIYSHVEQCLKELSDLEFQQRVWLRGEGHEISSYQEIVCQLFDDTGIGDQLNDNPNEIIFSRELDSIFRELSSLFDAIDYRMSITDILYHPNWERVRHLSFQALRLIQRKQLQI